MSFINKLVESISGFLWDYILLFLLLGAGLFFTIRLKGIQFRKFGEGFKNMFKGINLNGEKADKKGMSSFQSLTTALAGQIGTGNIVGVATAIATGGAGAIFWMWVSGLLGMATIYAEAVLAQKYKYTDNYDGSVHGGPVYYIRALFKGKFGKFLAGFFAVAIILALGFMGNMVQSNSIGSAFNQALNIPTWVVGIVLAVFAGIIFLGGVKRIASFTEKVVPIMAILYMLGAIVVIGINYQNIGSAFQAIFVGAFNPQAVAGGVLGATLAKAMSKGVARGLFSNEAGMGSTPHAHALAKVDNPCQQGSIAIVGVFIDTFIVLTLSALVILTSGVANNFDPATNANAIGTLTQQAFSQTFGKLGAGGYEFGEIFIAICLFFFAFSTIIGWYFFGETNVKYLFKNKYAKYIYAIIVIAFVMVGSVAKVDLVWNLSDIFNGLMVIPNIIAIIGLSSVVRKESNHYDEILKLKKFNEKIDIKSYTTPLEPPIFKQTQQPTAKANKSEEIITEQ